MMMADLYRVAGRKWKHPAFRFAPLRSNSGILVNSQAIVKLSPLEGPQ